MGLFDNIFLDQDSPTAMLDPLLTEKQKKENAEAREASLKQTIETANDPIQENNEDPQISDAEVMEILDGNAPANTIEDVSMLSDAPDDISFDIGGIDLPVFESGIGEDATETSIGSGFLSGNPSPDIIDDSTLGDDSAENTSVAMVQGATSGNSESIMDISSFSDENVSDAGKENESVVSEITNSIDATSDPQEEGEIIGKIDTEIQDENTTGGLLDIISGTPNTEIQDEKIPETNQEIPLDAPILDLQEDKEIVSQISPITDGNISGEVGSIESVLEKCIDELKAIKDKAKILHNEMSETEEAIYTEFRELDEEYATRKRAIEYKKKHMNDVLDDTQKEQARLEKIIFSLQTELAQ